MTQNPSCESTRIKPRNIENLFTYLVVVKISPPTPTEHTYIHPHAQVSIACICNGISLQHAISIFPTDAINKYVLPPYPQPPYRLHIFSGKFHFLILLLWFSLPSPSPYRLALYPNSHTYTRKRVAASLRKG